MKTFSLVALVLGLVFAAASSAQETAVEEPVCNDEFAKFLVDQQVSEGRTVAETDKRVRILTRSADFLWKFDEPRAREYFSEAYKVATERFAEKGFEKKEDRGITSLLPDYRFEVIKAIAKRDGKWAQRLSEELLKEYEKAAAERKDLDKNREIEAISGIAVENVKANPALSWYLFRRLMREPLSMHWLWALNSVDRSDRQFAVTLYDELLRAYANAQPSRLLLLSAYPFGRDRIFGFESANFTHDVPEDFVPNPAQQSRFIDVFLRRSDAYTSDPNNLNVATEKYRQPEAVYIVAALADIEPLVLQNFPAFLPRLNAVRSKAFAMLSEENRKSMSDRDAWRTSILRTFEERIAEIEKADAEGKLEDSMIISALTSNPKTDKQFKMLEPWIDKISEAEGRAQTKNYFWFLRAKLAIKEKRYPDARDFAAKVPELEHRAILMFDIAEKQLADVNDAAGAYQTLADVAKITRSSEDSLGKVRVHLGLATLYEKFNHGFAISELSDAVAVANKVKDANLLSGYVMQQIKVKNHSFFASFGVPGYGLENSFTAVSKDDFSLPLSNAKALDDKFYRTIAVIAIAKNCIDRPKPKRTQ